jgi:hypothetical protein
MSLKAISHLKKQRNKKTALSLRPWAVDLSEET